jgi:hypothetical protein
MKLIFSTMFFLYIFYILLNATVIRSNFRKIHTKQYQTVPYRTFFGKLRSTYARIKHRIFQNFKYVWYCLVRIFRKFERITVIEKRHIYTFII